MPDTSTRNPALASTVSGRAYAALRADVLTGSVAPGAKLKMEDLQRRYGSSSSPLREALSRLVAEGIVTVDERRGFRAAEVSLADLRDITSFRLILEPNAFAAAIERGGIEWEAQLVAALHRLESVGNALAAQTRPHDPRWIESHKAFHSALISACGSSRLLGACAAMFDQSQRYRTLAAQHRGPSRNARAEHRRLLEAALRRDVEGGRRLLGDHIAKTADQVSNYLGGLAEFEGDQS